MITWKGEVCHLVDLVACRRALMALQVARMGLDNTAQLASEAGCSRSTFSRFLSGGSPTSLKTAAAILKLLGLPFESVAFPVEQQPSLGQTFMVH